MDTTQVMSLIYKEQLLKVKGQYNYELMFFSEIFHYVYLLNLDIHLPTAFNVEAKSMIAFNSKCSAIIRLMKKHGIPRKNRIMMILSTSESVRL